MGDSVGHIDLGLSVDRKHFNKQLNGIAGNAEKMVNSSFKGIGKTIAAALSVGAVVTFTKSCLDLGSNLSEVQNVVDVTFGSMNQKVNDFAKNAITNFGLSETVSKKMMGTYGAMSKAFGFSTDKSYEMSEAITGLTADVASFYNLSTDEAATKMKSIWTGETESLKELGVVMTQTALDQYAMNNGFGKTTAKMTEQEKVMLRYQFVQSQLSAASGDFIRTQDGWANQTRVLTLRFEQLKATLGQGFINLFTPIVKGINILLGKMQELADGFLNLTALITGNKDVASGIGSIASSADDASENILNMGDAATKSAKEAAKALYGFDQITKVGEEDDDSGTSSGSTSGGTLDLTPTVDMSGVQSDTDGIIKDVKKYLEKFQKWATKNFGPSFNNIWNGLIRNTKTLKSNLSKVFNDLKGLGGSLGSYFKGDFTQMLKTAFDTAGLMVNGLFETFNMVFSDIWNKAVYPMLQTFVTVGLPMMTQFYTKVIELNGTVFNTIKKTFDMLWRDAISPALTFLAGAWCDIVNIMADAWNKWGLPIFDGMKLAVEETGMMFEVIWKSCLKPIWDNFMDILDDLWTKHMKPLLVNFLDFVGEFVSAATTIYNEFISPIVKAFSETLGPVIANVLSTIHRILGNFIGSAIDKINSIITVAKGIIKFIKGVFTADWTTAWEGIKMAVSGVFDGLEAIIKTPINGIIELINGMIRGIVSGINAVIGVLNKLSIDIPDWVPEYGGETFGFDMDKVSAPQIPLLAQGAYVKANTPQLAMIGDNRHEGEIVAPESKLMNMARMAAELSDDECSPDIIILLKEILSELKELKKYRDVYMDLEKVTKKIVSTINRHTRENGVCEIL